MVGCSSSSDSSSSLSYSTGGGSSTVSFSAGTQVILIDQDYDSEQSQTITDYEYCNDSNGACTTYDTSQQVSVGNSIDTVLSTISNETTSITVPFEIDANDLVFKISSTGTCGLFLGMNTCD